MEMEGKKHFCLLLDQHKFEKVSTEKGATKTFSYISKDILLTWGQDQQPD